MDYIGTSRPTAVNLFNALNELKQQLIQYQKNNSNSSGSSSIRQEILNICKEYSEFMLQRDVQDNKMIGENGSTHIWNHRPKKSVSAPNNNNKLTVMTICNTGSLATAGYGTALGVIRSLIEKEQLQSVIALETRPYNQGSRLTAYEMMIEQMPNSILICDSMASFAIQHFHVNVIVVGADRICSNGDTANKIGTYQLSIIAQEFNIPFYVAAPFTTLDINILLGNDIHIEQRPAIEVIQTSNAPNPTSLDNNYLTVWNPAFDITPAKYITGGIITEKGIIIPKDDGTIDVKSFVEQHQNNMVVKQEDKTTPTTKLAIPEGYTEQTVETLPQYIVDNVPKVMDVLDAKSISDLSCCEMGDGNLNLVFIVSNNNTTSNKKVIVKQALPYVRCVGESWPMTIDRSYYEYTALTIEKNACPDHVPDLYYFSKENAIIIMEYLAPPIQILRKGLINGIYYPTMAINMGTFTAKTLFNTSGYKLSTTEIRNNVQFWSTNHEMCSLTESVVFTEPYIKNHSNNRWTTPQLDDDKLIIENDIELKIIVNQLKHKFVTYTQSLIHADLHTGSVMCGTGMNETYVIDPEFAFYGPMAFDLGAFIANLLLSYISQIGHINNDNNNPNNSKEYREKYSEWILEQISTYWNTFVSEFTKLYNAHEHHIGFVYGRDIILDHERYEMLLDIHFFHNLLLETIGFAGIKMIRRIVGIAHVEDLESITDINQKVLCERRGLNIGKLLIKRSSQSNDILTIHDVIDLVRCTV